MAIPEDRLATATLPEGEFLWGRGNPELNDLNDYEFGGIALNDPSLGLEVQEWHTYISADGTQIFTESAGGGNTLLYTGAEITEISCSFDQNMRPAFAFVEAGVAKFEWYDTQLGDRALTVLGAGVVTPRVTLDDKRSTQLAVSDVLLFYVNSDVLYMKRQRDRYGVEYTMGAVPTGAPALITVGMSTVWRLVFQFRSAYVGLSTAISAEEAISVAPDDADPLDLGLGANTVTQFDVGSSTTWKPDNEEI